MPRRLPQLNPVPLWVHDPGKSPIIVVLALGVDPYSIDKQRLQEFIQIFDAKV
jgi:hypothetical protein